MTDNILKRIMKEFDEASDDACFEGDHPIFKMAEDIDHKTRLIAAHVKLMKEAAEIFLRVEKELCPKGQLRSDIGMVGHLLGEASNGN